MSTEQEAAPAGATAQPDLQQAPPELLERMNQFIRLANRMERNRDTQYAVFAFLNAFARYSAHHYLSKVKHDTPEERQAYADYVSRATANLALQNIEQMSEILKSMAAQRDAAAAAAAQASAGAADAE